MGSDTERVGDAGQGWDVTAVLDAAVDDSRIDDSRIDDSAVDDGRIDDSAVDDSAIDDALRALLEATGAHDVFIDENLEDQELGLCARVTHEVVRSGFEHVVDPEIWLDEDTGIQHCTTEL